MKTDTPFAAYPAHNVTGWAGVFRDGRTAPISEAQAGDLPTVPDFADLAARYRLPLPPQIPNLKGPAT